MSLQQARSTWERLGEADPLWAVLSTPGTRDGAWDVPWFLETGRIDLNAVRTLMSDAGVDFGRRALDFGCGVGRLTQVLAEHVEHAVGVDLAESMIRLAHEMNQVGDRVRFVHNDNERLPFDDDSFDSALSLMVLQHLPPGPALRSILELLRVVRPGGILALQIPSHPLVPAALPPDVCRARITVLNAPSSLPCAAAGALRVSVANTGVGPWPAGESVRLANHWLLDGTVAVGDDGRAELPHAVQPGESVGLELRVTAPDRPGRYELELDVVQEFVAWWSDLGSPTTRVGVAVSSAEEPETGGTQHRSTGREPAMEPAVISDTTAADQSKAAHETSTTGQPAPAERSGSAEPAVRDSAIEMHPMHVSFVRSLFEQLGATVLAVGEDDLAGPGWASRTYVIEVG